GGGGVGTLRELLLLRGHKRMTRQNKYGQGDSKYAGNHAGSAASLLPNPDSRVGSGAQLATTLPVPRARIPLSTYRLQFNRRFTFKHAAAIVPYLDGLGVTDCYASSYLAAVPGSEHGYNVADPTRLNPEIGTAG